MVAFNNMFTPLNQNHNYNTCAAINHLLDIYTSEANMSLLDLLWYLQLQNYGMIDWLLLWPAINTCYIAKLLHSRKPYFRDFSASIMRIVTEMIELYFVKLQFMVIIKNIHIVFFYQYWISLINFIFCISLPVIVSFHLHTYLSQTFSRFLKFFYFFILYIYIFSIINS